jgi:hypothetical protein
MTQSGKEPTTFQLVAQCLKQLRNPVPPIVFCDMYFCRNEGYGRTEADNVRFVFYNYVILT